MQGTKEPWGSLHLHIQVTSSTKLPDLQCVCFTVFSLNFQADDGKCKVTMKYPHFFPVSRKCKVPETRKKLEIAYQSRCLEENTKILEELIELRQEQAEMLGYESHAHYIQVHIFDTYSLQ